MYAVATSLADECSIRFVLAPPPPQPTLRKIEVEEIVVKRVPITDEAAEPAPTPPTPSSEPRRA
jgi:hypothetical protein